MVGEFYVENRMLLDCCGVQWVHSYQAYCNQPANLTKDTLPALTFWQSTRLFLEKTYHGGIFCRTEVGILLSEENKHGTYQEQ